MNVMKVGPSSVLTKLNVDKVQASIPPSKVNCPGYHGFLDQSDLRKSLSGKQLVRCVLQYCMISGPLENI